MKKLKRLKKIIDMIDEYTKEIKSELDKTNKEHKKLMMESTSKLIAEIARGEDLDELMLIEKYSNKSKIKQIGIISKDLSKDLSNDGSTDLSDTTEELLSCMSLDGTDYFYEDKLNGVVFNNKNEKVGEYKDGQIKLNH